jgi:L-rhamnose isomerase/sugar isomerase
MHLEKEKIEAHNHRLLKKHRRNFEFLRAEMPDAENILQKLIAFQVAIPSWALGTGGTRFARFPGGGEPRSLEEKLKTSDCFMR